MSLALEVTAGVTFSANSRVTASMLNAAALPVVLIKDGSITGDLLDPESITDTFGDTFRSVNSLPWGSIDPERFAVPWPGTLLCPKDVKTEPARGWFVIPTGADVSALSSPRDVSLETQERGRTGLKVLCVAGLPSPVVTSLVVGTWLPPALAQQLRGGFLTFSVHVFANNLGGLTPTLEVSTPSASALPGDEGMLQLRTPGVGGGPLVNGVWTRESFYIDASSIDRWDYGVRLALKFTGSAGNFDAAGDYVIIADAQIDPGVQTPTPFLPVPPKLTDLPVGTMFPYAGTIAPPGWLLCDHAAVSRSSYARLFQCIGVAHGAGDGSNTFNVPDGRGRAFVGREEAGLDRMQISGSATGAAAQNKLTVLSTAGLRLGMGAFGAGVAPTAEITDIAGLEVTLSLPLAGGLAGTPVRFGKLGPGASVTNTADPEIVGAAGEGMGYGRNEFRITKLGCTVAGAILTVPGMDDLACGMTVSGLGIAPNTVIEAFLSGGTVPSGSPGNPNTMRLSTTSPGAGPGQVTFGVEAPEGNSWDRYQYLRQKVRMICRFSTTTDQLLQAPYNRFIKPGMAVAGTNIVAGTWVTVVSPTDLDDFTLSVASTSPGGTTTQELSFDGGALSRAAAQTPDALPAFVGNWIIKT